MRIVELTDNMQIMVALYELHREPFVVIDLETTGLNPRQDKILDIVIATTKVAYVIPGDKVKFLKNISHTVPLVFHNFKFDLAMLANNGVDFMVDRKICDTMLMHHLLDETASHALDSIIQSEFNDNYKEVFWSKYATYDEAPRDEKVAYAGKDGIYTALVFERFKERVAKEGMDDLCAHVHALAYSLFKTELRGLIVDKAYAITLGSTLASKLSEIKAQLYELTKEATASVELRMWLTDIEKRKTDKGRANVPRPQFNFESSKQLQALLYNELGLPAQFNAKTKALSTDDNALAALEKHHPVIPLLRQFRELQKVYGTYIEGILERVEGDTLYPSFNVNGTVTGRISHSNPNMGNMPREGGIRAMFIVSPNYKLISGDYSQLETVIAAHFSHDPNLLKIINDGASQHDITAQALGIPRQLAKTLNFAMQYRCSHFKVAEILGVSAKEGLIAYNKYWEAYSGIKRIMQECDKLIDAGEPIVTLYGRKRRFPKMARQPWDSAYRQGFSAKIQGSGGDLTNEAFYIADRRLRHPLINGRALFTVHDEIIIEVPSDKVSEGAAILKQSMVEVGVKRGLTVPLKAEIQPPSDRWED